MFNIRHIILNHIHYEYIDEGHGTPIVLLHGFPDSKKLWFNIIPTLVQQGYRVIAPDLRGYGNTDIPVNFDIRESAYDLFRLLASLNIKETHIIGHDWGALLGWFFSSQYPTKVKSYIPISVGHPNGYCRSGGVQQLFKGLYIPLFLIKPLAEKVMTASRFKAFKMMDESDTHRLQNDWISDMSRPGRLTSALNWYRENYSIVFHGFNHVNVPVYGMIGDNDPALTIGQMAGSWRYVNHQFNYTVITNAGHWLPITHSQDVTEIILNFYHYLNY